MAKTGFRKKGSQKQQFRETKYRASRPRTLSLDPGTLLSVTPAYL